MIKALLLIFDPVRTWERIVLARRNIAFILFAFLLPLMLLSSAAEAYGLLHWGKSQGEFARVAPVPRQVVLNYEVVHLVLSLVAVFLGANIIKSIGETFHGRHSFTQSFTSVAYGLSPLFLVRLLDAVPMMSNWVTWGIGIILSVSVLYHGLPRVMLPDPPHALGLYFMSALLLIIISGLTRFLANLVLTQHIKFLPFFPTPGAHL